MHSYRYRYYYRIIFFLHYYLLAFQSYDAHKPARFIALHEELSQHRAVV